LSGVLICGQEQEELKKQIQGLKETITERANKIVHEIMPQKAIDLNKLFLVKMPLL
jgi:hypothetical protein